MKSDKNKGKKKRIKVDFTGVETRTLLPEGQYHAKVHEISQEDGDKAPYLKWVFAVVSDDKTNGAKLFYNTSLAPQALWNLRNLLETLGVETPSSEMELDTDEYIGLELMLRVEHETWEGKDRAKVTDFTPLEETASTEDDDEGEKEETDDEESEDAEEEEDGDEEEESDGDEGGDESDEEEDDGKLSATDVKEMDDAELADVVKKHKLKVELKAIKKHSKRVAAVLDALETKDLLSSE